MQNTVGTVGTSGFWLLVPALMGLACGSSLPLHDRCPYGGQSHALGDTFSSTDGCNTCSCTAMGVACTLRACLSDAGSDAGIDANAPVDANISVDSNATLDTRDGRDGDAGNDGGDAGGDAGSTGCAFDRTYTFRNDGGLVAFQDSSTLSPARTYVLARDHFINSLPKTCTRQLACADPADVDVAEIMQALAHPDVVAALAMTTKPFYGTDPRPIDGTVFIFGRDDQRGFTVGGGTVPAGMRALVDLLTTLQLQTAATPGCANL